METKDTELFGSYYQDHGSIAGYFLY